MFTFLAIHAEIVFEPYRQEHIDVLCFNLCSYVVQIILDESLAISSYPALNKYRINFILTYITPTQNTTAVFHQYLVRCTIRAISFNCTSTLIFPFTSSFSDGLLVPTPTFWAITTSNTVTR